MIRSFKITPLIILYAIIIALSISPSFALGAGNRNLLLIGLMGFVPIILLRYPQLYTSDILILSFFASITLCPLVMTSGGVRWSTVLFSIMFGLLYMAYTRLLYHSDFGIKQYLNILKYLLYTYCIVLIIQQFCVLTGLPIFNISNYDPTNPWKLNSLTAEPSHSARIIPVLMYLYITVKKTMTGRDYDFKTDWTEDKYIWLAFLWPVLTMGSSTAFLFMFLVLFKTFKFRFTTKQLLTAAALIIAVVTIIPLIGGSEAERTFKFTQAVFTLNEKAIIQADHSGSIRIVPMIICAKMVDMTSVEGWFGHGIDYVSTFMYKLIPGLPKGATGGGGLFQFWLEYGFLSLLLFCIFSLKACIQKNDPVTIIIWILLIFMSGINNQMTWFTIILLSLSKHFTKINSQNAQ